jgi:DNA invertase Pin-like site-specific DNA recombinase
VYARLSKKKTGRRKRRRNEYETVERQIAIIRRWAAEQGVTISDDHIYIDNHLSAWRPEGERPAWEAMLAAAERGEFNGILVYKIDRFTRNAPDAYALTRLGDMYGLVVDGPRSGRINLRTTQGRKTFRDAASTAEFESDNLSERARDALRERAEMGLQIGGGRLFGFEILDEVREFDDDTEPVQRPDEVAVIREVASRFVAGETWTELAADLNARGSTTTRGNPWNVNSLREAISAPRNNGWVVLHGKTVGRNTGELVMQNGKVVSRDPGEHILDDDTYADVVAAVASRRRGRRPSGEFSLSGVLLCAAPVHGSEPHRMTGHGHRNSEGERIRDYLCSRSHGGCGTTILAVPVEAAVRERVLEDANNHELVAKLSAEARALSEARTSALAKVERLDGLLADLEDRRAEETIRPLAYERAKKTYERRIAEAEAEARQLGAASKDANVPALTGEQYDEMTPAETKQLINRLCLRVLILPKTPGLARNQYDPDRVKILPEREA